MTVRKGQAHVRWLVTASVLFALAVAGGIFAWRLLRPSVTVSSVAEGPVVQAFYSTGTVSPDREYPIKSPVEGTLIEVRVDKGDRVTRGEIVARVIDPKRKFEFDKVRAELDEKLQMADDKDSPILAELDARIRAAELLLQVAEREEKRIAEIVSSNAGAQADLDRAMDRVQGQWSALESFKAQRIARKIQLDKDVQVAESALSIAKWNLEEQELASPIDGVVLDRPISQGTHLNVNDPIMRIADVVPKNLVMRAAVDEEDVANVSEGQTVRMTLYAFPKTVFNGEVSRIYDQADLQQRTFEVDIRMIDVNDRFAPGMTGELAFILAEKSQALVVPRQAVQGDDVWTIHNGRLKKSGAKIGLRSIERAEIISGMQQGNPVVISPIGTLEEGDAVRTEFVDPSTAAGLNKIPVEEQPFKAFD